MGNMKVFAATVLALATAEKKVPPRHPLQRLNKLNKFANEWVSDNLDAKQAANWDQNSTETLVVSSVVLSFADFTMRPANTVGPEIDDRLMTHQFVISMRKPVSAGTIKTTQSVVFNKL